jgi:hypothetical protein
VIDLRPDPLVGEGADRRHHGVNIAVAWPWPKELEATYQAFARSVAALHPGLYVYPFATTHITVLTAVNFKSYPDPNEDLVREIDRAAVELATFVEENSRDLPPFTLELGHPVLVPAAAFVPMTNRTGEIAKIRERALRFCRAAGGILGLASAPQAVHSTILRFRGVPSDPTAFASRFAQIARGADFGDIAIDRLLVTLETKPYMREGSVVRSIDLSA